MGSFYTRTGDDGYTGLLGKGRVSKSDRRIEALGTVDEANAALGLARAMSGVENTKQILLHVQRDLYGIMTELSTVQGNRAIFPQINQSHVTWLEEKLDDLGKTITIPAEFILPGDTIPGAGLDLARTVVRRAERRVAELSQRKELTNANLLCYLNRLSSLCFVIELVENYHAGQSGPTLAKGT
jgi:cob(I)alamin adenosyltransferase